jgi:hypothetical protein
MLLALLAGCAYYLLASQTNDERASAAEINLAGRRRMLQRIGLLASQLQQNPRPADIADLEHSAREMADIHRCCSTGRRTGASARCRIACAAPSMRRMAHAKSRIFSFGQLAADATDRQRPSTTLEQIVSLGRAMC